MRPEKYLLQILTPTLEDDFERWVDDHYPRISLCGHKYYPSWVLKKVDMDAYKELFEYWKTKIKKS